MELFAAHLRRSAAHPESVSVSGERGSLLASQYSASYERDVDIFKTVSERPAKKSAGGL